MCGSRWLSVSICRELTNSWFLDHTVSGWQQGQTCSKSVSSTTWRRYRENGCHTQELDSVNSSDGRSTAHTDRYRALATSSKGGSQPTLLARCCWSLSAGVILDGVCIGAQRLIADVNHRFTVDRRYVCHRQRARMPPACRSRGARLGAEADLACIGVHLDRCLGWRVGGPSGQIQIIRRGVPGTGNAPPCTHRSQAVPSASQAISTLRHARLGRDRDGFGLR